MISYLESINLMKINNIKYLKNWIDSTYGHTMTMKEYEIFQELDYISTVTYNDYKDIKKQ